MASKFHILSVVGTRPNLIKLGPLADQLKNEPEIRHTVVHTGQHFDDNMSTFFFQDLDLPTPDINLGVQGGGIGDQTGRLMVALEKVFLDERPDLVIVFGDVNSTFAATYVAVQNHFRVAHVEAGLRSFDRDMPEEINRILTDVVCDVLFTTHSFGDEQLEREGVPTSKVFMVGDIMIDSVAKYRRQAENRGVHNRFDVEKSTYGLVTLHRPSNVDDKATLTDIINTLLEASTRLPFIFAVHPRTKKNLESFGLMPKINESKTIHVSDPVGYLDFLSLILDARVVLTDSGGIQEETTYLNIPCLTLRENTERPFCVSEGTNSLVGRDRTAILKTLDAVLKEERATSTPMPGWDGNTAKRIVDILKQRYLT